MTNYVAYVRVSTDKQGKSGLGLEAQEAAIRAFLRPDDKLLAPVMVEVESGKVNERPVLTAAVARCKLTGSVLLIAKLDRLSRDAHFLLGLEKAGIDFVCADMPSANRLTVGIMAMVAEEERRMISARTTAALAATKARGTVLGGFRGHRVDGRLGAAQNAAEADQFAARVLPLIEPRRAQGASLAEIAAELTAQGVVTPRGGAWTATAVRRVLARG